jgi:hypothetical protein
MTPAPESLSRESVAHRLGHVFRTLSVIAMVGILGIRYFSVISYFSVNVLYFDQWDFLAPLFQGNASLGQFFFWQHGPHREGLGLIADSLLYPLTDWNTRAESFLIAGCVFTAMLFALVLKYRLFGRLSWGDAAIPMIFLTLAQYETFIGTPNAGLQRLSSASDNALLPRSSGTALSSQIRPLSLPELPAYFHGLSNIYGWRHHWRVRAGMLPAIARRQ